MRVFGDKIGILAGDSSSLATGSISIGEIIDGINIFYASPEFTSSIDTGSIARIDAIITTASDQGAQGELVFTLSNTSDIKETGSALLRMFHTGSSNEPRVAIGFDKDDTIEKTFEIRTKKDDKFGSELILEGGRTTTGASVGDEAGKINFVINSGSYNDKFTSGSLTHIKAVAKNVSDVGVQGRLVIGIGKDSTSEPEDIWNLEYDGGTTGGVLPASLGVTNVFSGSIQVTDFTSTLESSISMTDSDANITFALQNINNTQGSASMYLFSLFHP